MKNSRLGIFLFLCFIVSVRTGSAQEVSAPATSSGREILSFPPGEIVQGLSLSPMPELGDSRLDAILSRYYLESFGGVERWNEIKSLRISGTIHLDGGTFKFTAAQKKPDLLKMSIRSNRKEIILGYDGEVAWKHSSAQEAAEVMLKDESRRFANSATFGSLLLYPFAKGKVIEYIDTVPLDNSICHFIRVTLDSGFQIDYYIDIQSYIEIKSVTTDLQLHDEVTVLYEDYDLQNGIPIATKVTTLEEGEVTSELQIEDIKVNSGIMPWMFKVPE